MSHCSPPSSRGRFTLCGMSSMFLEAVWTDRTQGERENRKTLQSIQCKYSTVSNSILKKVHHWFPGASASPVLSNSLSVTRLDVFRSCWRVFQREGPEQENSLFTEHWQGTYRAIQCHCSLEKSRRWQQQAQDILYKPTHETVHSSVLHNIISSVSSSLSEQLECLIWIKTNWHKASGVLTAHFNKAGHRSVYD